MKYVFFGSAEFSAVVLEQLILAQLKPVLIVTTSPKPAGRKQIMTPTKVKQCADKFNIPVLMPNILTDDAFIKNITGLKPDFALLTAYGKIIPELILKIPKKGFVNLHPSLLPRWRGATPIQSAILNGDPETGVSLFEMDKLLDHGPIIAQAKYLISNSRITFEELSQHLAKLGVRLILDNIYQWFDGKIISQPQDESLATSCHKISPTEEHLNWQDKVEIIDRKIRAFNPNPGVFTIAQDKIIKIIKGFPIIDSQSVNLRPPGEVFEYLEKQLAVQGGNGYYVIEMLKPSGKNVMTSDSFLRGNKWIIGQILI